MPISSPSKSTLVSKGRSSDRVSSALALAIHEHRLAPGTKLGEDEIGEIYSVSRTVVRTALQSLAHVHLIDVKPNRGAFVAQPSLREAREVFEARELLEPRTARSAANRATADDVAKLQKHIEQEHAAMDAGDNARALYLSGQFHVEIARIADQVTISEFVETLIARSSLIIALYWRRETALCESHAHGALMKAFENNDGQRAEELMHSHIVDLHSALDLRERPASVKSLKDVLGAK